MLAKTPKIYKFGAFVRWHEGFFFSVVGICTFTVQSVRRLFYLVLWFLSFAFFVSVLVPRARRRPVKPALTPLVLWAGAGAGRRMTFLLHGGRHFDFVCGACVQRTKGTWDGMFILLTVYFLNLIALTSSVRTEVEKESGGVGGVRLECNPDHTKAPLLSPGCLVSSWWFFLFFCSPKLCSSRMGSDAVCLFSLKMWTVHLFSGLISLTFLSPAVCFEAKWHRSAFSYRQQSPIWHLFPQPTFDSHSHVGRRKRNIAEMRICLHCQSY